jgi:hypothetical protein
MMFLLPSAGLMVAGEFISLDEPTEVSDVATVVVFPTDEPKGIGSERRREPRDPTRNLKLPIVRSISQSRLATNGPQKRTILEQNEKSSKNRARVGGCG